MRVWSLLLLVVAWAWASGPDVVAYVRDGCPHCTDAKVWLEAHPEVSVELRDVGVDHDALEALEALAATHGLRAVGVPTFVVGDQVVVGFGDGTGDQLLALISARGPPDAGVRLPIVGRVDVDALGLPAFTFALGLADGFNPCATWVLLFLLSVLVRQRDRRRMVLVAGTFVIVSGAVYYAFMAAWLNVFLLLGMSRTIQVALALVALAVGALNAVEAWRGADAYTLAISGTHKQRIAQRMHRVAREPRFLVAMAGIVALAVLVNLVELLCTAGLPAVYTQVLTSQGLPSAAYYGYLGLYILAYMLDDVFLLGVAALTLSQTKLQASGGRQLKLLSGLVMLALGLVLLLRPDWLVW